MAAFPAKRIAVISSASTANFAYSLCVVASMFIGSAFRMEIKPEVGLRVYMKAGDVANGSWSSCVDSADPVSGFARGCPFEVVSVQTSSWRSTSLLTWAPTLGSRVAGVIPGVADNVHPSTLGSADGPMVPNGDDPATPIVPCDAVGPSDAPVIQDEVDPVIPNAVASMCDGDADAAAQTIPWEDSSMIPAPVLPVSVIPGHPDP